MRNNKDLHQIKKIFLICFFALFACVTSAHAGSVNLAAGWDGNGKTGAGSEPNKFGWACTNLTSSAWTQAGSGEVRFMDNQAYLPNGRLLFVRWDGVGGSAANSIYSYPVQLQANKTYTYSIKYTRHSNQTKDFVLGVNSKADNSGESLASGTFAPATQSFKEASFKFIVKTSGTYYLTIGTSSAGMLGAICDLEVLESDPTLDASVSSIDLNYFEEEKSIIVFPNGSNNAISLTGFGGINLSPNSLPASGGTVLVSSDSQANASGNIQIQQGDEILPIAVNANFPADFLPTQVLDTLTVDGSWCWFADPRAIYHKGTKEQTYMSWITAAGDVIVASYNHETKDYKQYTIWEKYQADDHANPSLLIRNDGRIIIFLAKHFGEKISRFISTNPEDISSWSEDYQFSNTVTYPYPFQVGDSICVFYRGGSDWHPRLSVSTDNGQTFDDGRLFISGGGQRPYTRYYQGADGSIHVAVTTGHPRNESANKIHYCRFKDNKVYRANGTLIADVTNAPVDLNQLEVVYNGTTYGKGWIWDITLEPATGYPILVYASFPTDLDHRYHYARWDGTSWNNNQITEAGKWFPQTPEGAGEPEPNYSGGIILNPDDPTTVYLSKEVKGVFEIFKYTTSDHGQTWNMKALTWNTPSHLLNVRPIVPRKHKEGFFDVIWMRGTYEFYADERYSTALVFPRASVEASLSKIEFDNATLSLVSGETQQLKVNYIPTFASVEFVTWTSSNPSIATVENGMVTAVGAGTATIKAVTKSGIEAICNVTVKTVVFQTDVFFDFGTADSPVASGAIKITETTLLTDSYGWLKAVASRDRTTGTDAELRDFHLSSTPVVFKVYLENGQYSITVKQGDYDFKHDNMNLKVNGVLKLENVTNALGAIEVNTFDLDVDKKYAEFEFSDGGGSDANWVVNSIRIKKQSTSGIEAPDASFLENPLTLITVYDFYGRKMFQEKLGDRSLDTVFTTSNLTKGGYLVSMDLNNEKKAVKYIHNR